MSTAANQILTKMLPVTVGIVGHREIATSDVDRVRDQIRQILLAYRQQAPSTPILLLTAMAEGADQIAAEVAFGIEGVIVVAVLPMHSSEYEKDFDSEAKVATYRQLVDRSFAVIQTRDFYERGDEAEASMEWRNDTADSRTARDEAYRDCGRFISQQSHVLIAVWDGEVSSMDVGTSDTVSHRLNATTSFTSKNEIDHLWPQENGVLLHILAKKNDAATTERFRKSNSGSNEISVLTENFESRSWAVEEQDDAVSKFELLNTLIASHRERSGLNPNLTTTMMNVVDGEATSLQHRFKLQVSSMLTLGVLSLFMVDLQHDLSSAYPYFTTLFVVVVTAYIWFRFVKGTLKDRFYQFRALAEGLRVQSVWLECGVDQDASNEYLRGIPDVLWIPRAMRTSRLMDMIQAGLRSENGRVSAENASLSAKRWVESQVQYFGGTSKAKGAVAESRERYELLEKVSLTGVGVALLCLLLDGWRLLPGLSPLADGVIRGEQLILHLSLSISAASAAYSQLMAYREIERQYEISFRIFKQGLELLQSVQPFEAPEREHVQFVVTQIGVEALRETGTWLALKRDRAVHPI